MDIDVLIHNLEIFKSEGISRVSILRNCGDGDFDLEDEFFFCRYFEDGKIILITSYL